MIGQAHWIDFIPVLLIAATIGVFALQDVLARRNYRAEYRRFVCPKTHREVDLVFLRDAASGAAIGVKSCSAFLDPETVNCDKPCLPQLRSQPA